MKNYIFFLKKFHCIFIGIFVLFFITEHLHSTTFKELTLKELCINSTDIIIVRVVSLSSHWNKDRSFIFSEIELEVVNKVIGKFQEGEKFTILYLGGSINGITSIVVGAPIFRIGEKSLLFLSEFNSNDIDKNYEIVGLAQGKFNIFMDKIMGKENVTRDQISIPLKLDKEDGIIPITDSQPIILQEFLSKIRNCIH